MIHGTETSYSRIFKAIPLHVSAVYASKPARSTLAELTFTGALQHKHRSSRVPRAQDTHHNIRIMYFLLAKPFCSTGCIMCVPLWTVVSRTCFHEHTVVKILCIYVFTDKVVIRTDPLPQTRAGEMNYLCVCVFGSVLCCWLATSISRKKNVSRCLLPTGTTAAWRTRRSHTPH